MTKLSSLMTTVWIEISEILTLIPALAILSRDRLLPHGAWRQRHAYYLLFPRFLVVLLRLSSSRNRSLLSRLSTWTNSTWQRPWPDRTASRHHIYEWLETINAIKPLQQTVMYGYFDDESGQIKTSRTRLLIRGDFIYPDVPYKPKSLLACAINKNFIGCVIAAVVPGTLAINCSNINLA